MLHAVEEQPAHLLALDGYDAEPSDLVLLNDTTETSFLTFEALHFGQATSVLPPSTSSSNCLPHSWQRYSNIGMTTLNPAESTPWRPASRLEPPVDSQRTCYIGNVVWLSSSSFSHASLTVFRFLCAFSYSRIPDTSA